MGAVQRIDAPYQDLNRHFSRRSDGSEERRIPPRLTAGEMASGDIAGCQLAQEGDLNRAAVDGDGQRGWKGQPLGMASGLGSSPRTASTAERRADRAGCGLQQSGGIGMGGGGEQPLGLRQLDDVAEIHDGDAAGDVAHHRRSWAMKTVRPNSLLQVQQQIHHLRLNRDVESARRARRRSTIFGFVASARAIPMRWRWPPQIRADSGCPRSRDKPTFPNSQPTRSFTPFPGAGRGIVIGSSSDLRDGQARIERGVGILENHLHARR